MTILPIITIPDPVLRKKAASVEQVDAALLRLAQDMLASMYDAPGIGLAAPQVGILRRLIVMDPARDEEPKQPLIMVNPVILERGSEMRIHDEGCLSIPDVTAEIERPALTRVSFIDMEGKPQEQTLEGIWSTLVQHEIDHLNGVLFIDYMSRLKRDMIVKKFTKQKRTEAL
ncbi:peptide deformylase [Methyloceanibacter sp.]|uniref:peptide deformylase n=1 Tax=Methyloceanibacter sp. TaxID=1965321 RepID=UPI003D6D89E6